MYSAKINGKPTTFGTSGLLYRSNKLMYDRATDTIWHQFTGEPVMGPLADSGIRLAFFPVTLTTWAEWLAEHPDTTVISNETPFYDPGFYAPESNSRSIYYSYRESRDTMFPVSDRSSALDTRDVVLGLAIGDEFKAYPIEVLQRERVINDVLGGTEVVVIGSSSSQAARAYERQGRSFSLREDDPAGEGLPGVLVDSDGAEWLATEDYLAKSDDGTQRLKRIPTHTSYWFGWFAFHPDTQVYTPNVE